MYVFAASSTESYLATVPREVRAASSAAHKDKLIAAMTTPIDMAS